MRETSGPARAFFLACVFCLGVPLLRAQNARAPMTIRVDAREASRGILHVEMEIPARPGPLTLLYPKWIPGAPVGGIEASGWRVVFRDTQSDFSKASEETSKTTDLRHSIGLTLAEEGVVRDIIPGTPAAEAGMAPGMKLMAVNGRRYSPALLREAIKNAKGTSAPIELLAEDREFYKTYRLDYHDGERYPHLERDESRPDLLEGIIRPRAPGPGVSGRSAKVIHYCNAGTPSRKAGRHFGPAGSRRYVKGP